MITVQACRRSRLLTWHSVGDDGAFLGGLLLTPLPSYGGVAICCVRCRALFVWLCSFRRVIYNCFYFLNDKAVLLLSFQIKKQAPGPYLSFRESGVNHKMRSYMFEITNMYLDLLYKYMCFAILISSALKKNSNK